MPDDLQRALVVSVGRNSAWIAFDGEDALQLAKLPKRRDQSMLLPGDVVRARVIDPELTMIERVDPRTFTLVRTTGGEREKAMAANVDTAVIVAAMESPALRLGLIDRILAFSERSGLHAIVVLTKTDLAPPELLETTLALYRSLGVDIFASRPKFGEGVEPIRTALEGRHALLVGQSGVGKSSLFRALGGTAAVGAVNEKTGKGRQTTTTARLYRTASGFLIDSPGVREFALGAIGAAELTAAFPEMREPATRCRFKDCTHDHEPDCAVLAALAAGAIAPSRYQTYRNILEQVPEERFT